MSHQLDLNGEAARHLTELMVFASNHGSFVSLGRKVSPGDRTPRALPAFRVEIGEGRPFVDCVWAESETAIGAIAELRARISDDLMTVKAAPRVGLRSRERSEFVTLESGIELPLKAAPAGPYTYSVRTPMPPVPASWGILPHDPYANQEHWD